MFWNRFKSLFLVLCEVFRFFDDRFDSFFCNKDISMLLDNVMIFCLQKTFIVAKCERFSQFYNRIITNCNTLQSNYLLILLFI
jgi:hypothetical protein